MHAHAALAQRVVHYVRLAPKTDRAVFDAMIAHAMSAAGALTPLLSDAATALLFRASRGVPRVVAHLLRSALFLADERGQNDLDEAILLAAIDVLRITPGTNNPTAPIDPIPRTQSGTNPRK
jgi:type II secretory pathway predicted ATPase ExeA